jgi:hypothetical protein
MHIGTLKEERTECLLNGKHGMAAVLPPMQGHYVQGQRYVGAGNVVDRVLCAVGTGA